MPGKALVSQSCKVRAYSGHNFAVAGKLLGLEEHSKFEMKKIEKASRKLQLAGRGKKTKESMCVYEISFMGTRPEAREFDTDLAKSQAHFFRFSVLLEII